MSDDREVTVQGMRNAADFIRQQTGVDLDWLRAAADEIDRLRAAKTAALKISDERAIEAVELREEIASADRACQRLCSKHGYATGHGDTAADMIDEISAQIPLTN